MGVRPARLLIIDDDVKLGAIMARALAPEHEVLVLTSAHLALARIALGERFDLVLCDLMLPGVSGVDFYERLAGIAPELVDRVVFVTGGAYSQRAVEFLERAHIPRIEKPFPSLTAFRAMVREYLARTGRAERRGHPSASPARREAVDEDEQGEGR
jgi:DNA-binding NtrC family response regulator